MAKICITGCNGLLGQKLVEKCIPHYDVWGIGTKTNFVGSHKIVYSQQDLRNTEYTLRQLKLHKPDIVINTAALTQVDQCETQRELAYSSNVKIVKNLISGAVYGYQLVQISTDYIFNGESDRPYDEDDPCAPVNFYGNTKLEAEQLIQSAAIPSLICRTAVLIGTGRGVKKNFALWLFEELKAKKKVGIVDDQISNTTLAENLADMVLALIHVQARGVYHTAGSEILSRYDFAIQMARHYKFDLHLIEKKKTTDLKQSAQRPRYSGLSVEKFIKRFPSVPLLNVVQQLDFLKKQLSNSKF